MIVSTDDPQIGRVAEWYGAEYFPRPPELATDEATLVDVGLNVLDRLSAEGMQVDAVCQLMPNCPLRRKEDIVEHFHLFEEGNRRFQISVVPYRGVYPQWAIGADSQMQGQWVFGSKYLVMSQHLNIVYCPTGVIWWVNATDFREQRAFYGNPFHIAPIDANRGIDIDRMDELELAEILVHGLTQRNGVSPLETITQSPCEFRD